MGKIIDRIVDPVLLWRLRRKLRRHGYSEQAIAHVVSMYRRPKPYKTV